MNWFLYAFQDLRKQKSKAIFGIGGIAISIMLLTIIGSLGDSLSYSNLAQATSSAGSADFLFTKAIVADINYNPYFPQSLIQDELGANVSAIDYYFPRLLYLIPVTSSNSITNETITKQMEYYGLNTTLEQNSGEMGNLWIDYANYTRSNEIFEGPIPNGDCILTTFAAKLMNVTAGAVVTVQYLNNYQQLTVEQVVDSDMRFSAIESTLIITELPWAQNFLQEPGMINNVEATLKDPQNYYNSRDIPGTTKALTEIGTQIQQLIGFDYMVTLPKMLELSITSETDQSMTLMFFFMDVFSMLITGILINSILSTSIEERIREFGIMRTVGAKKSFTIGLVVITGLLMALIGTAIGLILGLLGGPFFIQLVTSSFSAVNVKIPFVILPTTILETAAIGVGVTTAIAILPALKAGRVSIIQAIDPSRANQKEEWHFKKEGSANAKLMIFGIGIATIGFIIFVLFPDVLASENTNLMDALFMILLMCVLLGLVFACIGLIPLVEIIISQIFRPLISRYYPVYRLSLSRYRRRNSGTVMMFAMTFAFIFFISTYIQLETNNTDTLINFEYGSDIIVSNSGSNIGNNTVDINFYNQLNEMPGVKSAAIIEENALDIAQEGTEFINMMQNGVDLTSLSMSLSGPIPKNSVQIGDIGDFYDYPCDVLAINQSYVDTVNNQLIMWDTASGSSNACFNTLFNNENCCIIAKSLADAMGISTLGSTIRLTFNPPKVKNTTALGNGSSSLGLGLSTGLGGSAETENSGNLTEFKVVGISEGLPGMWNFRSSQLTLTTGMGVLLNMADYARLMNYGPLNAPTMLVDKILVDLYQNDPTTVKNTENFINGYFSGYAFTVEDPSSITNMMNSTGGSVSTLLQTILIFSIIISLFGLVSSMYATIIERMYEIGILRAMGLKQREMRSMLMSEAITIMISSGSLGMAIGIVIAYLLNNVMAEITEVPTIITISASTLASTYLVSLIICIIGMYAITYPIHKWSIVEILRHTF